MLFCLHLSPPGMDHPNIKIEDNLKQTGSDSTANGQSAWQQFNIGPSTGIAGGIYYARNLSRVATDRCSISPSCAHEFNVDVDEGDDWHRDDRRKKQIFRGKTLLWSVSMPLLCYWVLTSTL